jgi:flagellar P-ring protein precursor FlgI
MPIAAKPGTRLDVTVSSLGDAKSLLGGVLLLTPLKGVDGEVYALSQGPLTIGGFSVGGEAAQVSNNVATVGIIPGGALVERAVPFEFNSQDSVSLALSMADFSTTQQVVDTVNVALGGPYARARDVSTVEVAVPERFRGNLVPLMASLENLEVRPDSRAKVVVDEKTGTVIVGANVRLAKVAISHGNLQVVISESADVSQPPAFSSGSTVVVPQTEISVREENNRLVLMEGATLQELVDGLNAIGATPRDLVAILRALKTSGALMAELEVI